MRETPVDETKSKASSRKETPLLRRSVALRPFVGEIVSDVIKEELLVGERPLLDISL